MKVYKLNIDSDFEQICHFIAPHKSGAKIMEKKANLNFILKYLLLQPLYFLLK